MKANARTIKLFSSILIGVLLIHVVSAVPFYMIISREIEAGAAVGIPYAYIASRLIRFIICIAFSLLVRRKLTEASGGAGMKCACISILIVLSFVTLLYISGLGDKFYLSVSYMASIYGRENAPLFPAVLWEQVFSVDLLYSVLLGSLAAAAPRLPGRSTAN